MAFAKAHRIAKQSWRDGVREMVPFNCAAIALDVYGTLVDPLEMRDSLAPLTGDLAEHFAARWREKQLEFSFRRGLMRCYKPFSVCTREALAYTAQSLKISLSVRAQDDLMDRYRRLPAFPDSHPGLAALRDLGLKTVAFSNGEEDAIRALLTHAGLIGLVDGIISVDEVKSFKPDPAVYQHLVNRTGASPDQTWMVSSNSFDVIGAINAGLKGAWIKRRPDSIFDSWGIIPDLVATDLLELSDKLRPAPGR